MATELIQTDIQCMRRALQLAQRGYGRVSPNPMVGALLVQRNQVIGEGWHQKAGCAHAEINAILDAQRKGNRIKGATLYVTLEPCSTKGRTPPCTSAILDQCIQRVVIACQDPNPAHAGNGMHLLQKEGIEVVTGVLALKAQSLNRNFFHWITHHRPRVTVKAAMTLDGKIATATGQSKWITGPEARKHAMKLRFGMDAMMVGIETILADDPSLTVRTGASLKPSKKLLRIVLDSKARTPLKSKIVTDDWKDWTRIIVSQSASQQRIRALKSQAEVWESPDKGRIHLPWLMDQLGEKEITSLLVEGGGEVNASILEQGLVQEIAFYYAPKILGGSNARKAIAGQGAKSLEEAIQLTEVKWRKVGKDLVMQAMVIH